MNKLNYPTWLVPLDIAKKLKEIGFNEHCVFYTRVSINDTYTPAQNISVCNDNYNRLVPGGIKNEELSETETIVAISLPTWEQVFEWFREKGYDSYIGLESHSYIDEGNYYYFEITKSNLYNISQLDWKGDFDDYNEAREALVKVLIRTYKQEQPIMDENE